jgi:hypothetical protein
MTYSYTEINHYSALFILSTKVTVELPIFNSHTPEKHDAPNMCGYSEVLLVFHSKILSSSCYNALKYATTDPSISLPIDYSELFSHSTLCKLLSYVNVVK